MIVCCDNTYGIGKNNALPWMVPSEMNNFKEKTIGSGENCVIMGKNTFMSIPEKYRPLKNRHNLVLTRDKSIEDTYENTTVITCPDDILSFYQSTNYSNYWIIGGKMLYEHALTHFHKEIKEVHLSILPQKYECDTFLDCRGLFSNRFFLKEETNYNEFMLKVFKNRNTDCL